MHTYLYLLYQTLFKLDMTHDFVLPPKDDKNFIPRVLYSSLLNR